MSEDIFIAGRGNWPAVVMVFGYFVAQILFAANSAAGYLFGSALFSLGVMLFFFAQLFHIRAALERRSC